MSWTAPTSTSGSRRSGARTARRPEEPHAGRSTRHAVCFLDTPPAALSSVIDREGLYPDYRHRCHPARLRRILRRVSRRRPCLTSPCQRARIPANQGPRCHGS
jgi:hypothetical protein